MRSMINYLQLTQNNIIEKNILRNEIYENILNLITMVRNLLPDSNIEMATNDNP